MEVGRNLVMTRDGDELVLAVDLNRTVGPSSTGATELIASSGGNKPLGATGVTLGLNLYVKVGTPFQAPPATTAPVTCGTNCSYTVTDDGTMHIRMAVKRPGRASASGKTTLVCTANERGVAGTAATLNLNAYSVDPSKIDLSRVEEPSDFTVQVAGGADGQYTVASVQVGADRVTKRRIAPIPGHPEGVLKLAGNVGRVLSKPATVGSAAWAPLPGATNIEYAWGADQLLKFRFDHTVLGTASGTGDNHLLVASTGRGGDAAAAVGVDALQLSVLRPRAPVIESAIRRAVEQHLASVDPAARGALTLKELRASIAPAVEAVGAKCGFTVDLNDGEAKQALRTAVTDLMGSAKRERDEAAGDAQQ